MAKSLSDNALFCARSSSRCFSSRALQAFSSNSFTFAASSAALAPPASSLFPPSVYGPAAPCPGAVHRPPALWGLKDEVKHVVQGRVNIRRRGGGGGDGKRVKVRVSTRDINLLCRVFQGPSPLLACHLRVSRGRRFVRIFPQLNCP